MYRDIVVKILNGINRVAAEVGFHPVRRRMGDDGRIYVYTVRDFVHRECIFVHIPKTAGMSVSQAIFGHCCMAHKTVQKYPELFGAAFWPYYRFTFTRNPFTRLVSAYECLKHGGHPAWSRNRLFLREIISPHDGFDEFVEGHLATCAEKRTPIHFAPQTHFLKLDGQLAVDFVGRYERLSRDFATVSSTLGVDATLPETNTTPGDRHRVGAYCSSDAVIRRVRDVYSSDSEKLGYFPSVEKASDCPKRVSP